MAHRQPAKHCDPSVAMDEYVEENTLTVNVNRLRKKLSAAGLPGFIVTKVGSGYAVNQEGSV